MTTLKYHQNALSLLHRTAEFSELAVQQLSQLEQDLKIQLSPSFKEWFSLNEGREILSMYSNQDHVLRIDDMRGLIVHEDKKLLLFLDENQAVSDWCVEISDADDPPVWARLDEYGFQPQPCTEKFSDFIFAWLWNFQPYTEEWFLATGKYTDQAALNFARNHLNETVSNHVFGQSDDTSYRFWGVSWEQRIDIMFRWNRVYITDFAARDEQDFVNLIQQFRPTFHDAPLTFLDTWDDKTKMALSKLA